MKVSYIVIKVDLDKNSDKLTKCPMVFVHYKYNHFKTFGKC